jgi:hypothetical protein
MRTVTVASLFALATIPGALAGCEVSPKARTVEVWRSSAGSGGQQPLSANEKKAVAAFYLQASRLDIDVHQTEDKKDYVLTVANTPVESTDHRLLLVSDDDLFSRTNLNVAKRPNTDLIASIGTDLVDNRIGLINNVASVAKVLIPFVGAGSPTFKVFDPIEVFDPIKAKWSLKDAPDFIQTGGQNVWTYRSTGLVVTVGPAALTARPYSTGLFAQTRSGVFMAACRPVTVSFAVDEKAGVSKKEYVWRGKIADPEKLEFVALPRKGKIEFHSECGASVTAERDPSATPDAIAAAAAAAAASVIESSRKAKS